jgi:hypothetical protein
VPRILEKLTITEVSSCDRGAGEGVKVMLMKRDAPPHQPVTVKDIPVITGDALLSFAKRANDGEDTSDAPAGISDLLFNEIQDRAAKQKQQGDTPQTAFSRYVTTDATGRALMAAHGRLSRPSPVGAVAKMRSDATQSVVMTKALGETTLDVLAKLHHTANPALSFEQSYAKVATDPAHAGLLKVALGKDATGAPMFMSPSEIATFIAPGAPKAAPVYDPHVALLDAAGNYRKVRPDLSIEQSYAALYADKNLANAFMTTIPPRGATVGTVDSSAT